MVEPNVNANIHVLHEDEALIVLNKPAPLPMHAGGRFNRNSLQYILQQVYYPQKPRPAHRLDANTTGLVLITRTRHFAAQLQPQFSGGEVEKVYIVRAQGTPPAEQFSCNAPISIEPGEVGTREVDYQSGAEARTEFRVIKRLTDGSTLLEARPITGRTNQIRIHLWELNLPVCGDPPYLQNQKFGDTQTLGLNDAPLCLHSWKINFKHPLTKHRMGFTAPLPQWASC
jgi:RluA family pseudouridine synthase